MGMIGTPDAKRAPHIILVECRVQGDSLIGSAAAVAMNKRFCLPYAIELHRAKEDNSGVIASEDVPNFMNAVVALGKEGGDRKGRPMGYEFKENTVNTQRRHIDSINVFFILFTQIRYLLIFLLFFVIG